MASILGHPGEPAGTTFVARHAPVLAVALAFFGILAVHAETAASIVAIWWRSETYAHGFVVLPICAWLAWQRRDDLARTPAVPWMPALALVAAAGALWFVMTIGDVVGVRQFALAFMLQAAIVAVAGLAVARIAAFPIVFLLFAVPAGEFLIPTLIEWTADFTVAALRASGVPVYREANHFIIPSGAWSVVEACSGLRYLIASVMIGVVYAAVTYRSAWRRAAFIAASVLVPVVANWLRAYMIVMTGHLSDNRLAVGVDHLIYGWVFFGIVMALLFWVGSFWSEPARAPQEATATRRRVAPSVTVNPRLFLVAIVAVAVAAVWRPLYATMDAAPSSVPPTLAALEGADGFVRSERVPGNWQPAYSGHAAASQQAFEKDGAAASVYVAFYRNPTKGRELVTSQNNLVAPENFAWKEVDRRDATVAFAGRPVEATRIEISGARERLVAWRVFWVDGRITGSEYVAKGLTAWSKLRGRGGDAALIVVHAQDTGRGDEARAALEALSPRIAAMLDAAGSAR